VGAPLSRDSPEEVAVVVEVAVAASSDMDGTSVDVVDAVSPDTDWTSVERERVRPSLRKDEEGPRACRSRTLLSLLVVVVLRSVSKGTDVDLEARPRKSMFSPLVVRLCALPYASAMGVPVLILPLRDSGVSEYNDSGDGEVCARAGGRSGERVGNGGFVRWG
jgi:hypothetical protein